MKESHVKEKKELTMLKLFIEGTKYIALGAGFVFGVTAGEAIVKTAPKAARSVKNTVLNTIRGVWHYRPGKKAVVVEQ